MWDFNPDPNSGFHVIGMVTALSGSLCKLDVTNQNKTLLAETVQFPSGTTVLIGPSDRVVTADVIICSGNALPGPAHAESNYTDVDGGFRQNGRVYAHLSAHLNRSVPLGGNLGFKDGHVQWKKFNALSVRRIGWHTPYFSS